MSGGPARDHFRPHRPVRRLLGPFFGAACLLATLVGVAALTVLLGAVVAATLRHGSGLPWYAVGARVRDLVHFLGELGSRSSSIDPQSAGFRVGIAGTLWLLGLVAVLSIPLGVGAAVFLEEYPLPQGLRKVIQTNIANLAGVPSIVYGILGLTLFQRAFGFRNLALGPTLWAGALTLTLLILPTLVIATQEALRTVPGSLRQAALALGATRWQVIRDHVLPSAIPGIATGTILAVSRAIGETAPLLMVGAAASVLRPPRSPSDPYSALPVEIYNYAKEPVREFQTVAGGGILILLLLLLSMNATAIIIRNRYRRPGRG